MPPRPAAKSAPLRAVIYARYSTDMQREESIADQVRQCEDYARRLGWTVVRTYADPATSGEAVNRPEYEQMQADGNRGQYDVVIADTVARLDRTPSRLHHWWERLKFRNMGIHTVTQGELDTLKLSIFVGIAANYTETVRHETLRGQRGNVLAGKSPGGVAYGYLAVPGQPGVRVIEEDEAAVVRRIFALYADGAAPRAIAARLNSEGVRGPGGRPWADTMIRGQVARGTGILNNTVYVGRREWNKCSYVKDPATGKRQARPRSASEMDEVDVVDVPELRIVDDAIWERVKARQGEVRTVMGRDDDGNALNRAHRAQHLASGLLFCGVCGSKYVIVDAYRYGCNRHRSTGQCSNGHKVKRADLEERIVEGLRHRLMAPETIESVLAEMKAEHAKQAGAADTRRADVEGRFRRVDGQIGKIVGAIAAAGHSDALLSRLRQLEAEKDKLAEDLAAIDGATAPLPQLHIGLFRMLYKTVVEDNLIVALSQPDAARARESLRRLIERIVVTPKADGLGTDIVLNGDFAGVLEVLGLVGQPVESKAPSAEAEGVKSSVVAGAGFEPATFRL